MTLSLLVSARVGETRIAALRDGAVEEIHFFRSLTPSRVGHIYLAYVRRLAPEFSGAFIELEPGLDAFLAIRGAAAALTEGQKIIVQVKQDASVTKPVEATMKIELTSRYLQFRPLGKGVEISSEIPKARKADLKDFLQGLGVEAGGIRLRSAAASVELASITAELTDLRNLWAEIEQASAKLKSPARLYRDTDPALSFIRDHLGPQATVLFDRADLFAEARLRLSPPEGAFKLHKGGDLFADFEIDQEIQSLFENKLPLPGGGSIVIEETEALTAIDVNAGATVHNLAASELGLLTNIKAAKEIARQLRLRQLGGLIVIDFIDMAGSAQTARLATALDSYLAADPYPVRRTGFSAFGLVELTRKKSGPSLPRRLMAVARPRPTPETSALQALALAETTGNKNPGRPLVLEVDEATGNWLLSNAASLLAEVETKIAGKITLKPRRDFAAGRASAYSE